MAGRIRSSLRAVRNLFLTGLDPASLAGMAAAVAVAGEYPPPGAGGGPPEFLTGPPGQGPPAPTGGSPGEFLAPSGKRGKYCPAEAITAEKPTESRPPIYLNRAESALERTLCLRSRTDILALFFAINSRSALRKLKCFYRKKMIIARESFL